MCAKYTVQRAVHGQLTCALQHMVSTYIFCIALIPIPATSTSQRLQWIPSLIHFAGPSPTTPLQGALINTILVYFIISFLQDLLDINILAVFVYCLAQACVAYVDCAND